MDNGKISLRQMQALLILNIFSTGVILLPGFAVYFAANDGWLVTVGGTVIALFYVFIINKLSALFPNDSFVEYSFKITGKLIGFILSLFLAFKLILTASAELRIFGEIIREWLLFQTPIYVTCGAMTALCVYAAFRGFIVRARIGELLIYIIFIPIIVLFLSSSLSADFTELLPAFKTDGTSLLTGSAFISLSFRPIIFALLIYPFVKKPEKIGRCQLSAVLVSGLILTAFTVITITKLGSSYTKTQLWPLLRLMDTIDFPGKILERQDAFILSFWIVTVFISVGAGVFFSSFIFGKVFGGRNTNIYLIPSGIIIFLIAMIPEDTDKTLTLLILPDITFGFLYSFLIPLLLYIIAIIKKAVYMPNKKEGADRV